jgi:outer membrane protein
MKALIRTGLVAVVLAAMAAPAFAQEGASRIGYVDLQRALTEVEEGRRAKAQLQRELQRRQQMLEQRQERLKNRRDELAAQESVMDPEQRRNAEMELQREFMELQQTFMTLQRELDEQEQQLTERIFGRMESILQEIADSENLDIILERSAGVLWARPSLDVTNQLVRLYNARHGRAQSSGGGD